MATLRVLWVTPHDLLTHDAFLSNDGLDAVEVRSLCGLSASPFWESLLEDTGDVTCPRCRAQSAVQALPRAA
jgi:hypothetical protein